MAIPNSVSNTFTAIAIVDGAFVKVRFEASSLTEVRDLLGLSTPVPDDSVIATKAALEPYAYTVAEACALLGGIGRTSLYRLLARGKLKRLPHTRRVLVTRVSLECLSKETQR